jgi:hypothetical protein
MNLPCLIEQIKGFSDPQVHLQGANRNFESLGYGKADDPGQGSGLIDQYLSSGSARGSGEIITYYHLRGAIWFP